MQNCEVCMNSYLSADAWPIRWRGGPNSFMNKHFRRADGWKADQPGPEMIWAGSRHVFAKGPDCPVLVIYQMWFCQKLLKKAKSKRQVVKIWWFLLNPHLVIPKLATSCFLAFLTNFWPKLANFCATRCGFHKNHQIFTICLSLLAFLSNFWQTTSGCLTKQDNFNLWPVHVWLAEKITKETNGLNRLIFIIASCISRLVTEKWGLKMDVSVILTTLLYFVISVALMYYCCCWLHSYY